jgi:type I restriction enzyme S subunit
LDLASNATTIDVIYSETMSNLLLAIPPLPEMAFLAGFLNRETARIDTLIAKQERLIELLQEKRQALISRAVTKGLNPDAAMKPSGVDWLGDVPAHWEVKGCGQRAKRRRLRVPRFPRCRQWRI